MKKISIIFFLLSATLCNAQKRFNPSLRKRLDSIMVLDQKYRDTITWLMNPNKAAAITKKMGMGAGQAMNHYNKLQRTIDSTNVRAVESIFARYGYPGKSMVGDSASESAWYVIQHSSKIYEYLPLIKMAAENKELSFRLYAMMLDRSLVNKKKEQIYGSQVVMARLKSSNRREWIVWPISNPQKVNALRKKAGFKDTVEDNAANLDVKYRAIKLDDIEI